MRGLVTRPASYQVRLDAWQMRLSGYEMQDIHMTHKTLVISQMASSSRGAHNYHRDKPTDNLYHEALISSTEIDSAHSEKAAVASSCSII